MEEVKVSIVIPAYNAERFIRETIESILRQTMHAFEIIIINDGSSDRTQEIVDEYYKKFPNIFKSYVQKNQGQSAARNNALQYVKGKYVAFIDADDKIADWYLERLYNAAERENADIAVCSYQKFETETGKIVLKRYTESWNVEFEPGYSHVFQYSPWARLIRTDFINKYQFKFSIGEQLEDGPYCMMIDLLSSKTVIINEIGYFYRVYKESVMGNVRKGRKKPKVPYQGIESAIKKVRENTNDSTVDDMLEFCTIKILTGLVTNMYKNCNQKVRKEICKYCYYIINKYFYDVKNNPYFKLKRLKKLPLSHRIAVWMFMISYKVKTIYLFSTIISAILRMQEKINRRKA